MKIWKKVKTRTDGPIHAKRILGETGFDEVTDIPFDMLVAGLGGTLIEQPLKHCDGKIVFGTTKTLIKVNSDIEFAERKRFVIAHELGHLVMHKNMDLPADNFSTLNVIAGTEQFLKNGRQELEANEFASELLMPTALFLREAKGKKFSPQLLKHLSQRFKTSLTATVFKYLQLEELHPICVVFTENGNVRFWKKSDGLKVWVGDITRVPPPSDSVAMEYIKAGYGYLYSEDEKAQAISKSTWFDLGKYGEDTDFYEYCIPTKKYKTVLSVIWED